MWEVYYGLVIISMSPKERYWELFRHLYEAWTLSCLFFLRQDVRLPLENVGDLMQGLARVQGLRSHGFGMV